MAWQIPKLPETESARLQFLSACGVLDAPADERFDRLARLAACCYRADVAFVSFVDRETQWLVAMSAAGLSPSMERDKSVCQLMITSGRPLVVGDFSTDPRFEGHPLTPGLPFRSYAGVPILTDNGLAIGSVCILNREPINSSTFDIAPLFDLAAAATDAVMLIHKNRKLDAESRTDPLTDIANRRAFDEALDRALRRVRRSGESLSLLTLDLDRFKGLNDSLGHPSGDAALCRFAEILATASSRPDDFVARVGGEEFAVLLPETDARGAIHFAENIRSALQAAAIDNPVAPSGKLTASIGVATVSDLVRASDLLGRADKALYTAKKQGRDRVVEYRQEPNIRLV